MKFFNIEINEHLRAAASVEIRLNKKGSISSIITKNDGDPNAYIIDANGNKSTLPPGTDIK